jgi:hypothetical protein
METTTKQNETHTDNAHFSKMFTDSASMMMEIYNKQMKLASNFYSNIFNLYSGAAQRGVNLQSENANWFTSGNELFKSFFPTKNGFSSNGNGHSAMLTDEYKKLFSRMNEINSEIMNSFTALSQSSHSDWNALSKQFNEYLTIQFETANRALHALSESAKTQTSRATELNRSYFEFLNHQFSNAIRQNQEIWNKIFASKDFFSREVEKNQGDKKEKQRESVMVH